MTSRVRSFQSLTAPDGRGIVWPCVTCNTFGMTVQQRVSEHRRRLRARGYRPVQLWVPDVRTSEFADEARRQAQLVASVGRATDDQDFVEAISIDWDEE